MGLKVLISIINMPRDLSALANESTLSNMPGLSKSGEEDISRETPMDAGDESESSMITERSHTNEKRDELHPYTQTLNISDVESCTRLEEAAFPPQERCTREKVSSLLPSDMPVIHYPLYALSFASVALCRRRHYFLQQRTG